MSAKQTFSYYLFITLLDFENIYFISWSNCSESIDYFHFWNEFDIITLDIIVEELNESDGNRQLSKIFE
jgi:hypothetical protein